MPLSDVVSGGQCTRRAPKAYLRDPYSLLNRGPIVCNVLCTFTVIARHKANNKSLAVNVGEGIALIGICKAGAISQAAESSEAQCRAALLPALGPAASALAVLVPRSPASALAPTARQLFSSVMPSFSRTLHPALPGSR